MRDSNLRAIFDKTHGHCHFCGDPLVFINRGWVKECDGHWEVDHVIQRNKGGAKSAENCLAACTRCNRLRWHRSGDAMRKLLLLGVIAAEQINKQKPTGLGRELAGLLKKRLLINEGRRKKLSRAGEVNGP
jgi:5-methylcytosine-specific restriction endonuclease McrA